VDGQFYSNFGHLAVKWREDTSVGSCRIWRVSESITLSRPN